jgi:hypothetical protein
MVVAIRDQQSRRLFMTNASGPNRGRRLSPTEIRPAVSELDRANVKIDVGYGCVAAQCGMVLIDQSDFRSAGRAENLGNDLPRDVLICGMHSHHRHDVHSECKLPHDAPSRSSNNTNTEAPIPLDVPAAGSVQPNGEKGDEEGQSSVEL